MNLELERADVELLRYALRAHIDLGFQSPERAALMAFLDRSLAEDADADRVAFINRYLARGPLGNAS